MLQIKVTEGMVQSMQLDKHMDRLVASGITVAEIARRVGINRSTAYRIWGGQTNGVRLATAEAIKAIRPKAKKQEQPT